MSKPELYKAIVRAPVGDYASNVIRNGRTTGVSQHILDSLATYLRSKAHTEVHRYLTEQNLDERLLCNVYVDIDRATEQSITTYVFSDANTALMFKLSRR